MANPPVIVNRRPTEGDVDVNALTPIRYGLRDEDTRVDLSSVYTSVSYARAVYRPEVLPLLDPALSSENIKALFSIFDDAAGSGIPNDPADQTIETVGLDEVYRIERTAGTPQEGFLFISDDSNGSVPYAAEVKLDIGVYSVGTTDYVTYADFTGVMVGLVNWPKNSGVFLFFRDDGVKKISITGPSSDGFGNRAIETTVVFDWSADIYTYKLFWDDTSARKKVVVLAVNDVGDEVVLAEFQTTVFNEFLNSVVLGGYEAADPPDRVVLVVGTDGISPGDQIDIYKADLFRFGKPLLIDGGPTGSSAVERSPTELILVDTVDDLDDWVENGEGEVFTEGLTVAISRDEDLVTAAEYKFTRQELDLSRQEWFILASIRGQESSHLGTFNTAMGIDIEDGTYKHTLRLLDDFFTKNIGLFLSGNLGDVSSYSLPPEPVNWEDNGNVQIALLGSASRAAVRAYLENDDENVSIDVAYPTVTLSTETRLSVGFIESGLPFFGRLNLLYFWVFPNGTFFEPVDGTFPEAQGWTRVSSGGTRSLTVENRLLSDSSTTGDYDIYYFADVDYSPESGAAIFLKGKVLGWTDTGGAVDPPRQEIGPVAHITSTTDGVQLRFVKSETGRCFAYLSGTDVDINDVLSQNEEGVLLSTEIDFREDHAYLLVLKPFNHIRLYVDYETSPSIEIPWSSKGLGFRSFPANLPPAATIAFGSLDEESGVAWELAYARASIGTGYDFVITPQLTEDERLAHVYNSEAEVLIDFEDVDP